MDRLGFWGGGGDDVGEGDVGFQYPLMDRLGFWGARRRRAPTGSQGFQYPLMDRLGFWGPGGPPAQPRRRANFSIR